MNLDKVNSFKKICQHTSLLDKLIRSKGMYKFTSYAARSITKLCKTADCEYIAFEDNSKEYVRKEKILNNAENVTFKEIND